MKQKLISFVKNNCKWKILQIGFILVFSISIPDNTNAEVAPPTKSETYNSSLRSANLVGIRLKLLSEVNAPTKGRSSPAVFTLDSNIIDSDLLFRVKRSLQPLQLDSELLSPDGLVLPLKDIRILATATGHTIDQRVLLRLDKMSIKYADESGRVINNIIDIDGRIIGEDGILGMEGTLTNPKEKEPAIETTGCYTHNIIRSNDGFVTGVNWGCILGDNSPILSVPYVKVLPNKTVTAFFGSNR